MSVASFLLKVLTIAPLKGSNSTKPSAASTLSASRMGVRDTPKSRLISNSGTRCPGCRCDSTINWRMRSVTSECKDFLVMGVLVGIENQGY